MTLLTKLRDRAVKRRKASRTNSMGIPAGNAVVLEHPRNVTYTPTSRNAVLQVKTLITSFLYGAFCHLENVGEI
jgi:hypothetical protein